MDKTTEFSSSEATLSVSTSDAQNKNFGTFYTISTIFNWKFYKCVFCPYRTKSLTALKNHKFRHRITRKSKNFNCSAPPEYLKCLKCKYSCISTIMFHKHIRTIHGRHARSNHTLQNLTNFVNGYRCQGCTFSTYSQLVYMIHCRKCIRNRAFAIENMSKKKTFVCNNCPFKTESSEALLKHLPCKRQKTKWLNCDLCPFRTLHEKELEQHEESVHCVKCSDCSYACRKDNELKNHILSVHVSSRTVECYKCELCLFITIDVDELTIHIYEDHVEPRFGKLFTCDICELKFLTKMELKKHVFFAHLL